MEKKISASSVICEEYTKWREEEEEDLSVSDVSLLSLIECFVLNYVEDLTLFIEPDWLVCFEVCCV